MNKWVLSIYFTLQRIKKDCIMMLSNIKKKFTFIVLIFFLLSSCSTVPLTGRRQIDLVSDDSTISMSRQEYDKFLSSHILSNNIEQTQMVKRVGHRIQRAVEQFFAQKNMSQELKGYEWEFNLIESKEANAWSMPGGKVAVYTGILPITQDEAGLATVLGHEIAHAVAKHGDERMSQMLLSQMGGLALDLALQQSFPQTRQLWMGAYGLGTQLGILLPYNRIQETEADRLGLIFMAMAGYDPRKAVDFWQRMAQMKKGQALPEFLSTHPSDTTRINNIKQLLPEALKYYRG
jgi:predicted Zn-dependent protease